jgi:hypothetical protein
MTPYHAPVSSVVDGPGIEQRLRDLGASVSRWGNGPGERYAPHQHDHDKVLVVVEGAIAFWLPEAGTTLSLGAGDRMDLPAGTSHAATVGALGVQCLEGHLPAGRLGSHPRRVAGWALGVPGRDTRSTAETADATGT